MILLIFFALLAGVVTILSPCILPILPIVLSSSVDSSGKRRPLGVATGFIISFTFFTLFLSTIVRASGIPAESLRYISVFILALFGLSLFVPKFQLFTESLFSKLTSFAPQGQNKHGFWGGLVIGLSLGLLWTPCVGPILASVISLAISGTVTLQAIVITFAYSLGTAIPMFLIMQGGSTALKKIPWLLNNSSKIQKIFGVVMVLTSIGIFFNIDRQFQTFILETFPQYGTGLTKFEDNIKIKQELEKVNNTSINNSQLGKPMSNAIEAPLAPELVPGGEWINSSPQTIQQLKGKVVLIDFWTYSCINCQRTFPYIKQWWNKYKDKGLVIIGVHSPEFEFEKNVINVKKASADFKLEYPIVQDNDFATWRAYNNRYWPAKYLIDKEGHIRYTHFGEGEYNQTEKMIQELLLEIGATDISSNVNNPSYKIYAQTPELYLGYGRLENFASPEEIVKDKNSVYTSPKKMLDNHLAFTGDWLVTDEYASPQLGSNLLLNFSAKEVYLVMRPIKSETKVKVYLDEKKQYFGDDNVDGVVNVDSDRLYKLINLPESGRHNLRLEFEMGGVEVFAFTFG